MAPAILRVAAASMDVCAELRAYAAHLLQEGSPRPWLQPLCQPLCRHQNLPRQVTHGHWGRECGSTCTENAFSAQCELVANVQ